MTSFVAFVARTFPSFYAILALTMLVLFLEYAATSLMIPLSAATSHATGTTVAVWRSLLERYAIEPSPRVWLWLFFVVMIARLSFGYLQTVTTVQLGKKVHRWLSGGIFRHVVANEPLTSVYIRSIGHYITLAGDDTSRCGAIIANVLQCAVSLCTALVALVILYQFSGPVFGAIAIFLCLCAATIGLLFRSILRMNTRANELSRELNTAFVEGLNSLRSIRALHAEEFISAGYAAQIATYVSVLFRIEAVRSGIKSFPAILLLVIAAVLMRRDSAFTLSEASLLAVTIIIIRIFASMGQFVTSGTVLLTDLRAIGDIENLIGRSSKNPAVGRQLNGTVDSLALVNVSFGFGARTRILSNLSCRFEKGRTYAVVGPSGVGKSTLADILLGLVAPDQGNVIVNDGHADLKDVRGRLMLVEQQPKIFSTSLRNNLLYGFSAPDDRLWDTLRLLDLAHTAKHMRDGLDTILTYQGENLSGGQRQRIGIARALIREPCMLILDEATSALDISTREIVLRNVRQSMRTGILILITHDPQIAELADEILDFQTLPSGMNTHSDPGEYPQKAVEEH